jgi:hypothetical protein
MKKKGGSIREAGRSSRGGPPGRGSELLVPVARPTRCAAWSLPRSTRQRVSIPAARPKSLDFFGTPLVIKPSQGQLSGSAGRLAIANAISGSANVHASLEADDDMASLVRRKEISPKLGNLRQERSTTAACRVHVSPLSGTLDQPAPTRCEWWQGATTLNCYSKMAWGLWVQLVTIRLHLEAKMVLPQVLGGSTLAGWVAKKVDRLQIWHWVADGISPLQPTSSGHVRKSLSQDVTPISHFRFATYRPEGGHSLWISRSAELRSDGRAAHNQTSLSGAFSFSARVVREKPICRPTAWA